MPSSYALGRHYEGMLDTLIQSGRYNSKSEVIRDGLRLLEEREQRRAAALEELREAVREGMESGAGIPAEDVLARLEEKYARMLDESTR